MSSLFLIVFVLDSPKMFWRLASHLMDFSFVLLLITELIYHGNKLEVLEGGYAPLLAMFQLSRRFVELCLCPSRQGGVALSFILWTFPLGIANMKWWVNKTFTQHKYHLTRTLLPGFDQQGRILVVLCAGFLLQLLIIIFQHYLHLETEWKLRNISYLR